MWSLKDPDLDIPAREAAITLGLMYSYVEDLDFYRCPTVNVETQKNSYTIIDSTNGHDCFPEANGAIVIRKLSEIKSPAERIVFDCEGTQTKGQSWTILDLVNHNLLACDWPGFWDGWSIWHNNGTTISFADTHVEYRQWTDQRTIDKTEEITPPWPTPPQPGNEDVAWGASPR